MPDQVRQGRFHDRQDAGAQLGRALERFAGPDVVVLGLPRGGVPVAAEVARHLDAPLDVMLVRKLGVPGHEELAFGAIASGGVRVLNDDVVASVRLDDATLQAVTDQQERELQRQQAVFIGQRPPIDLRGKVCLVVDDGLATGATMRAALQACRELGARQVIAAVPVGAAASCAALHPHADEVACLRMPEAFGAVGYWYDDFSPTSDEEVRALLAAEGRRAPEPEEPPHAPV